MTTNPTLVLGGTGKTGRRVAHRLADLDVPVRLGSRAGTPPFDWTDPAGWDPVLAGVGAVYLTYQPDLAAPGGAEVVAAFARRAAAHDVRRIVLLSGRGEPEAEHAEAAVRAAGVPCTVLRASWFQQNFSESHLVDPVRAGVVALPVGDVPEPFVDADDIADVAVAALSGDGHAGQLYELTGPRALTFAEAVAGIAAATGRDVRFTTVTTEAYAARLAAEGVPNAVAGLLTYLFTEVLDGRNAHVADGVEQVLGRPARDFAGYAAATAVTGVWKP
ncbi:NmrA family transcriptional regulator [Micromonospora sp. WMMC415]|uniref:NmrA family NAD(P)-binding protein n=1 Tax=Micromonospora sp. WMMC415 TaxID=2675222 RepID=UPI0012B5045A|nr:NmrA family NAD(P)-binding protein [Micromonospora sp. WMMC415]QGN48455.1 NmrA family transcriptional regulator [Micromonospora sp. WMMC415]